MADTHRARLDRLITTAADVSSIIIYVHRPKRPPRKRKAVALQVPAIVTPASRKRTKLLRAERDATADDPEAAAAMRAWLDRAEWGHGLAR